MPRRAALQTAVAALVGGAGAVAASASPAAAGPAAAPPAGAPLDPPVQDRAVTSQVGKKWYRDGSPKRFRGNTFIHHLDPGSPLVRAAADVRQQLLDDPLGALFATLPPDTYHVTFLDGTDETQRQRSAWPAGTSREAPMDEVSRGYLRTLDEARIPAPEGLRFTVRGVTDITDPKQGLSVSLEPDATSAAALSDFRSRTAQALRLDVPLDGYRYHVTLAYRLFDNTPAEVPRLAALRDRFAAQLPPTLEVDGCDFTTFENMVGFPTLLPLRW